MLFSKLADEDRFEETERRNIDFHEIFLWLKHKVQKPKSQSWSDDAKIIKI